MAAKPFLVLVRESESEPDATPSFAPVADDYGRDGNLIALLVTCLYGVLMGAALGLGSGWLIWK